MACCPPPTCYEPVLKCASYSASKSKTFCGFTEYNAGAGTYTGKRYKTETYRKVGSSTFTSDQYYGKCVFVETVDFGWAQSYVVEGCTLGSQTWSGSVTAAYSKTHKEGYGESSDDCAGSKTTTYNSDGSTSTPPGSPDDCFCDAGAGAQTCDYGTLSKAATTKSQSCNVQYPPGYDPTGSLTCSGSYTETWTLSDEITPETDEALISRTVGAIPTTANGTGCGSYRNLAADGNSFTVSQCDVTIRHKPYGAYLKVWLDKVTTTEGSSVTSTAYGWQTYVWNGVTPGDYVESDPDTWPQSETWRLLQPSADGSISVAIRYSCLDGYEPSHDGSEPNGYPG